MSDYSPRSEAERDKRSVNRAASCVAAVRWRGWRLPFVNYEAWQRGRDLVFVLEREGDVMLVPLALNGQLFAPEQSLGKEEVRPVLEALWEFVREGWQVTGRLHTAFVGFDAEDDFWRETFLHLGLPNEPWSRWR